MLLLMGCPVESEPGNQETVPVVEDNAQIRVSLGNQEIRSGSDYTFIDVYAEPNNAAAFGEISITIENTGTGSLVLTGVPYAVRVTENNRLFSIAQQPAKMSLKQDETVTFTVRFKPADTTLYSTEVVISNSSTNEPEFILKVYGQGKSSNPEFHLFYEDQEILANRTVDFGDVVITNSKTIPLLIKIYGPQYIAIDSRRHSHHRG
jgi:hypothetical protein